MNCNKKPLIFTYSHDAILQGVKQESSHLAVRKKDQEGNDLLNELAFDEAYLIKFRELFFDGQAEVASKFSAYLKDVPLASDYFDQENFLTDRDYHLGLLIPNDIIPSMIQPVDIKIKQFFVAYIMYRWLETKLPQEAYIYHERAFKVLDEAKKLLERKRKISRPEGRWF